MCPIQLFDGAYLWLHHCSGRSDVFAGHLITYNYLHVYMHVYVCFLSQGGWRIIYIQYVNMLTWWVPSNLASLTIVFSPSLGWCWTGIIFCNSFKSLNSRTRNCCRNVIARSRRASIASRLGNMSIALSLLRVPCGDWSDQSNQSGTLSIPLKGDAPVYLQWEQLPADIQSVFPPDDDYTYVIQ